MLTLELSADRGASFDPASTVALAWLAVGRRVEEKEGQDQDHNSVIDWMGLEGYGNRIYR
jgi:hypothetical protein